MRRTLTLRSLNGEDLATGDQTQAVIGDQVTSRLVFHFKDGSLHDETTVFTQGGVFRLVSDHLIQTGKAFPTPLDMSIDRERGDMLVKYRDGRGQARTSTDHLTLPGDLANGFIPTLLKNVLPEDGPVVISFVAATPQPRLVKLNVRAAGTESASVAGQPRPTTHFVIRVEIGGLSGLLAPLVGKQPPDSHMWILQGAAPAFVKTEAQLYIGGPLWRIEMASPPVAKD